MGWIVNLTVVPLMVFSSYAMAEYAADLPAYLRKRSRIIFMPSLNPTVPSYTVHVVDRMQKQVGAPAAENCRAEKKTLPLQLCFSRKLAACPRRPERRSATA